MTAAAEPTRAWDRQPGESEPAFAAFVVYRDQESGDRSIRRAAAALGKSDTLIGQWSSRHGWPARVAAWDAERDRNFQREQEKARKAAARDHQRLARKILAKVEEAIEQTSPDLLVIDLPSLARLLDVASKMERAAVGEAKEGLDNAAAYRTLWERLQGAG